MGMKWYLIVVFSVLNFIGVYLISKAVLVSGLHCGFTVHFPNGD